MDVKERTEEVPSVWKIMNEEGSFSPVVLTKVDEYFS